MVSSSFFIFLDVSPGCNLPMAPAGEQLAATVPAIETAQPFVETPRPTVHAVHCRPSHGFAYSEDGIFEN